MDEKGSLFAEPETSTVEEEEAIPCMIIRVEVDDSSPVPKSLDEYFLLDKGVMATVAEKETNTACRGQRDLEQMEVHTIVYESRGKPEDGAAAQSASRKASDTSVGATPPRERSSPSSLAAQDASSSLESRLAAGPGADRKADQSVIAAAAAASEDGAACGSAVEFPPKQTFYAGNPIIEVTKGLIHLYSPHKQSRHHTMVCLLAVPADKPCSELVTFIAPFARHIKSVRIIRNTTPNQYMALVDFYCEEKTNDFYRYFHGRQYNMLEPDVCTIAYVSKLEILKTEQGASLPPTSATELPNCPVCLEKLDDSVLVALCNHTFHTHCLEPLADNRCPLCRCVLSPAPVGDNRCMDCGSHESLWICLICGHVGCGRYEKAHAHAHFDATQHTYAMEVADQSVWDYAGDNFVHRLVQSTTDGKLVEVQEPSSTAKHDGMSSTEKYEGLQLEYTFLLTNQLESQRLHFEEKVAMVQEEMKKQLHQTEHQCRDLQERLHDVQQRQVAAEKHATATEKKFCQTSDHLAELSKELAEEREMTAYLRANQKESQERLQHSEQAAKQQLQTKDDAIKDLEEQVRDLMFHMGTQQRVASVTDEDDRQAIQDGKVTVGATVTPTRTTPTGRSHRKKRRG